MTLWPTSALVLPCSVQVPLGPATMVARSALLRMLSTSTPAMPWPNPSGMLGIRLVGKARVGATVSMRTFCGLALVTLPAKSVMRTLTAEVASPLAMSLLAKLTCQPPSLATVVVWLALPQLTLTTSPAAVPLLVPQTRTPAARSMALTTLSPATLCTVTPGALVSICHCWAFRPMPERLPAASVWRTCIWARVYRPLSSVSLSPLPADQLTPPSTLYDQVALSSKPLTCTLVFWLTPSLLLRPVSVKARLGAAGGRVSTRMRLALSLLYWPMLPAASWNAPKVSEKLPSIRFLGVKVAVYSVSLTACHSVKLPATLLMLGKVSSASLRVRRTVAVVLALITLALAGSSRLSVAVGAVGSMRQFWALSAKGLALPAASVWRTCTWPAS